MGKIKTKRIEIPIYNYPVILCFGDNEDFEEYLLKSYKVRPSDNFDSFCEGYAMTLEKRMSGGIKELNSVLFIKSGDRQGNSVEETVNHEAIHISWHMLDFFGIKLSEDNHESLTYLVTYIYREVMKNIEIWKKQQSS